MKKKVKITDDIPRYAKKGDSAFIVEEYKEKGSGQLMRIIRFKSGDELVFGEEAFKLMILEKIQ